MKLDKIRFAQIVAFMLSKNANFNYEDLRNLDSLIDFEVPEQNEAPAHNQFKTASIQDIEDFVKRERYVKQESVAREITLMFKAMADGKKIEAIKLHRAMTGTGLKESKDAVEIVTSKINQLENNLKEANTKLECTI